MTEKEASKVKEEKEREFKKGYVKALMEEGKKPSEIAGRISLSVSTVRAWIKKFAA